ncbi:signal peptide peptidase-like 2B isoform X2 [Portunus trituberculatus]|uniref:signal peptide peptidase-like 2B isoform X2 n=1 Tax=Portunus trituberculatus TaxID=210409 RepID=UPI001E1D1FA1|nr:signal peptide peptidase-like 2B isoform X2 [Portunus trituberculatus]
MAVIATFMSTIFFSLLSQHAAQEWKEYPSPGILVSRPNASSHDTHKFCINYFRPITKLAVSEDSAQYYQVSDALEWNVCDESEPPPATTDFKDRLVFITDNNCSTVAQASRVQSSGAVGTLIVRDTEKIVRINETKYNLTLAFIHNDSYTKIMESGDEVTVGMYSPVITPFTPSLVIIWVMALFTVALGSFWSGKVRHKLYLNERETIVRVPGEGEQESVGGMPQEETSMHVSPFSIVGFVILMCLMLLSLYYFYQYLVYVIMAMFCIASSMAVFSCLHPLVSRIPCGTCRTPYFNIYLVRGTLELRQILLLVFAVSMAILWVVMRKQPWAWILQDTLGIAFCINVLRMVRLPNLKICTILLSGLLVYDIFFVFITPLITADRKSIMVEVAKGGASHEQLPIVLKVPNFAKEITQVCSSIEDYNLLGFGDILVPGLLISFAFSFDLQVGTPRYVYYVVNVIGYGVGLLVTFVALWLLSGAQPALLYLVPFTLIPTMLTALIRGEFKAIWSADSDKFDTESGDEGGEVEAGEDDSTEEDLPNGT